MSFIPQQIWTLVPATKYDGEVVWGTDESLFMGNYILLVLGSALNG